MGVSFETYLRRYWDVQRDVVTTSLRRVVAGWDSSRVSVTDSKYELKVFAIFRFSIKISLLSFKAIFDSPNECLSEKYGFSPSKRAFNLGKGLNYQNAPA